MYCQKCGTENPDEANFCRNCGLQFQKEDLINCPACGKENPKTNKFCNQCGNILSGKPEIKKSIQRIRIFWPGRKGNSTYKMKVYINDELIGYGIYNKGFDLTYDVDLKKEKLYKVELKDWFSTNFSKVINFSEIENNTLEFENTNLSVDTLRLK